MPILVIEDDPEIASFVARGIRQTGHEVDRAADGQSGLQRALTAGYDAADAYSCKIAPGPLFDASAVRIGVPDRRSLETFGDTVPEADFRATVERRYAVSP